LATLRHPRRDLSRELRSITPSAELAAALRAQPVNLYRLASVVVEQVAFNATERNVNVVLEVPTKTVLETDGELVRSVVARSTRSRASASA
jgi:hypothetical protein